jgi:hypothetical protein
VAAPGGALGVEADLTGGEDAPLDGVDLADELAVSGQRDVLALEEDLEVGGPALLAVVGVGFPPKSGRWKLCCLAAES